MVMSMILILSGGAVATYLNFSKSQTVSNDARSFVSEIERVRTMASSLQYPAGCDSLKGYEIKTTLIDSDLAGLTVTVKCSPADVVFPDIKVLAGSVFSLPFELTFLPGSGYLSAGTDYSIIIQNKNDDSLTNSMTIGAYGRVSNN